MVSNITNRILAVVTEWQNRPLKKTYSFVFMDAIHYKIRDDKQIVVKAAYVVFGVDMHGEKEVLGIWVGANESSKSWLSVLNDLRNRGVDDKSLMKMLYMATEKKKKNGLGYIQIWIL